MDLLLQDVRRTCNGLPPYYDCNITTLTSAAANTTTTIITTGLYYCDDPHSKQQLLPYTTLNGSIRVLWGGTGFYIEWQEIQAKKEDNSLLNILAFQNPISLDQSHVWKLHLCLCSSSNKILAAKVQSNNSSSLSLNKHFPSTLSEEDGKVKFVIWAADVPVVRNGFIVTVDIDSDFVILYEFASEAHLRSLL